MKLIPRIFTATALSMVLAVCAQAQIRNDPPGGGGPGGGRGPGIEGSVVTQNARSPEVNDNGTITFRLQAPNARTVKLYTDMPKLGDLPVNGSAGFDMTKDANGVWSWTSPKLMPSYYQYWFVVDGFSTPDPQNTFVRPGSGVYKSVVGLPGKEADFMMFRDVPHGNLVEHHYFNKEIKVARRVVVYTPPGYGTSGKKYPVVYLLHGLNDYERGWTQSGMAHNIMDNLIAEKKAVPAIIVMPFGHATTGATGKQAEILALQKASGYTPPPPAPPRGGGPGGAPGGGGPRAGGPGSPGGAPGGARGAAPGGGPPGGFAGIGGAPGWNMEKEMLDYVIPLIEKEYRVNKNKNNRAIMGYSMGGGHSTSIGFGHPELFAYVAGFSGYGSTNLLTADAAKTNKNYKMIFIGSGTEDTAVNGGRTMHQALTTAGVKHTWSEDPGYGHDYQIWRRYLHRLLQETFRN
ncbi:MAG TPA: alpha/beta hydrolase-fold protein [Steroidobacteraceae bacterium]|nr:alpha/beta hydrolase-fold protein [Steroidobacteraceae bacterium]